MAKAKQAVEAEETEAPEIQAAWKATNSTLVGRTFDVRFMHRDQTLTPTGPAIDEHFIQQELQSTAAWGQLEHKIKRHQSYLAELEAIGDVSDDPKAMVARRNLLEVIDESRKAVEEAAKKCEERLRAMYRERIEAVRHDAFMARREAAERLGPAASAALSELAEAIRRADMASRWNPDQCDMSVISRRVQQATAAEPVGV
jgi:hypothetical protein